MAKERTEYSGYFDYAAATPMDPDVLRGMQPYFADEFYNPSSLYQPGVRAKQTLENARAKAAGILGARTSSVIFTAGGTEANNLAIQGVMRHYPGSNLVVSSIEHESVLEPAGLFECRQAPVLSSGEVNLAKLEDIIDEKTVLVSIMYANNEIGAIQPITQSAQIISRIKTERRKQKNTLPLYLHTDACQAANYLDLHVARLGVDMMTLNGGKIYGPKQSGVLYVHHSVAMDPLIRGGGQEFNLRSGTQNVAFAIGFSQALETAQNRRKDEVRRLKPLLGAAIKKLAANGITVNGSTKNRLPNNLHITLPGRDNERLMMELDQAGFQVATGSACSASSSEPSHVLKAIGLDGQSASSSLRITAGRHTTATDLHNLVVQILKLAS